MPIEEDSFSWFEPPKAALRAVEPLPRADASRHRRLAANILDSYSRATDLLAEALQNATDAIDTRTERDGTADRAIEVEFDAQKAQLSVTDTGVGMPLHELRLALAPNISFKVGSLARPRKLRARGEKGVGLSFMTLACDQLSLRTCDGERMIDARIDGANEWLKRGGDQPAPRCYYRLTDEPVRLLGSPRWTSITVGGVDREHFDTDLFAMGLNELIWRLRTETAIGNTAHLFERVGRERPKDIDVHLHYTSQRGTQSTPKKIPYAFLSPEEFFDADRIVDYEDVKDIDPWDRRRRLRGKALRYVKRQERSNGRVVDLYALVVDGREMRRILKDRERARQTRPPDMKWQGLELALRDMPAGVGLEAGIIGTRAWEQRLFALLQYDDLALDLGRKTIAARTRQMLNDVVLDAWRSPWGQAARQVQPSPRLTAEAGHEALRSRIERAKALPALEASIPYLKHPESVEATQAIFHELIATPGSPLRRFEPLNSRIFAAQDALIYASSPNGAAPLHVVFGLAASDIVAELDGDEQYAATADLAVVWEVDVDALDRLGLRAQRLQDGAASKDDATHHLELGGIGGRENIRLLSLRDLLQESV